MSKIERFEDLVAWQKARKLAAAIYQVTRQCGFTKDFDLAGQIQRAAVSTMANITLREEDEANFISSYQLQKRRALKFAPTYT